MNNTATKLKVVSRFLLLTIIANISPFNVSAQEIQVIQQDLFSLTRFDAKQIEYLQDKYAAVSHTDSLFTLMSADTKYKCACIQDSVKSIVNISFEKQSASTFTFTSSLINTTSTLFFENNVLYEYTQSSIPEVDKKELFDFGLDSLGNPVPAVTSNFGFGYNFTPIAKFFVPKLGIWFFYQSESIAAHTGFISNLVASKELGIISFKWYDGRKKHFCKFLPSK